MSKTDSWRVYHGAEVHTGHIYEYQSRNEIIAVSGQNTKHNTVLYLVTFQAPATKYFTKL